MKKLLLIFIIVLTAISLYANEPDFIINSEHELIGYTGNNTVVYVPEGVTCIKDTAFENSPNITKIHLPSSLENFSKGTFINIQNLSYITVDDKHSLLTSKDGILYIKDSSNVPLTLLVFPKKLDKKILYIPEHVYLFDDCFAENEYLEYIYSIKDICSLGNFTFFDCKNLKKVDINLKDFSEVPNSCFANCKKLETLNISTPNSRVKSYSIGNYAFSNCENLKYIDFNIYKEIGAFAFTGCGITSINIDFETKIHDRAFENSKIYKIVIDDYYLNLTKYLTSFDIRVKFSKISSNTLTDIYYKGEDGKQHLYNFKTKEDVY